MRKAILTIEAILVISTALLGGCKDKKQADVKGLYAELKDKVTIIKDMQTTFYGKQEFYIRDCNGYILTFAGTT